MYLYERKFVSIFLSILVCAIPGFSQSVFCGEALRFSPIVSAFNPDNGTISESGKVNNKITISADSIRVSPPPQVKPSTAMYHSLFLPGWGQFDNGRKKKAVFFLMAELVCIGGYIYVNHEINHGNYSAREKDNLRTDRNTFLLYWIVSKFFGMVDAYVDAQLADYNVRDITPEDLKKELPRSHKDSKK